MSDLAILDATDQAELVRRGDLTALELVDAAINRVEKINGELWNTEFAKFDDVKDPLKVKK